MATMVLLSIFHEIIFFFLDKDKLINKGYSGLGHDHTLRVVVLDDGLKVDNMTLAWRVMTTPYSLITIKSSKIFNLISIFLHMPKDFF
ncbi:hypothetical protein Hanom_Chr12g01098531 [Helianthus anomalus]